jgi:hypothetical protein
LCSFSGAGGPATAAQVGTVQGIALDAEDNLFIASDSHGSVYKVDRRGIISVVAGNGVRALGGGRGAGHPDLD